MRGGPGSERHQHLRRDREELLAKVMREKERRAGPQRQQEVATQRQRQVPGSVCPAARLVTRVRFLGTGRTVVVSLEDMNTDTKSCSFFLTKSLAVKKRRSSGLQMVCACVPMCVCMCVCVCAHVCARVYVYVLEEEGGGRKRKSKTTTRGPTK